MRKVGKGGESSWQASPPLLFQPLLGAAGSADVGPACPAGEGVRAALGLTILRKALERLAPSLPSVSSCVDPLCAFCWKHGWISESPELSLQVRRHLLQKPRGAGAGSHQPPASKTLWVAADRRWQPQHHFRWPQPLRGRRVRLGALAGERLAAPVERSYEATESHPTLATRDDPYTLNINYCWLIKRPSGTWSCAPYVLLGFANRGKRGHKWGWREQSRGQLSLSDSSKLEEHSKTALPSTAETRDEIDIVIKKKS